MHYAGIFLAILLLSFSINEVHAEGMSKTGDVVGTTEYYTVTATDASLDNPHGFEEIAERLGIGYLELLAANLEHVRTREIITKDGDRINVPIVKEGVELTIPNGHVIPVPVKDRKDIVINLSELRLYYFPKGSNEVLTYPVGIGDEGTDTPLGRTWISRKRLNPTWWIPKSILDGRIEKKAEILMEEESLGEREAMKLARKTTARFEPPGPENPLGQHALNFAAYSTPLDGLIRLHGTAVPPGVGRRISHGCIRMYPKDIKAVYERVLLRTPVLVIDEPVKLGWHKGGLYLEVHADQSQANQLETVSVPVLGTSDGKHEVPEFLKKPIPDLKARVTEAAGAFADKINWQLIKEIAEERWGVPILILDPSKIHVVENDS